MLTIFLSFLDHSFTYVNEEIDYEAKEPCRVSRNGHNGCVTAVKSNICPCTSHENKVSVIHSLLSSKVTEMFRKTQEGPGFQWFA